MRTNRKTPRKLSNSFIDVRNALLAAGVTTVNVHYIGEDDRYELSFVPFDHRGKIVNARDVPNGLSVEGQCLHAFIDLQERRYPKWWSKAGSFGVFEWSLARNSLKHYHHARLVAVGSTIHRGF